MQLTNYKFFNSKNHLYTNPIKSLHGYGLEYSFHFNGKELDNESQTQDYGMRIYDYRLGRFLSIDPLSKSYPELSSYQFASNTPIWAIDIDGLEAYPTTREWNTGDLFAFGRFVQEETDRILKAEAGGDKTSYYTVYTCSELVVSFYVRYAMANGLPVSFSRKYDNTNYSSEDKDGGVPQWIPGDPEGSKKRFELYVRSMTTTATLCKDGVNIPFSQVVGGDYNSYPGAHTIMIRPTGNLPSPGIDRRYYVDASIPGTNIRTNADEPAYFSSSKKDFYRFKEIAKALPSTIESRPLEKIAVNAPEPQLQQTTQNR